MKKSGIKSLFIALCLFIMLSNVLSANSYEEVNASGDSNIVQAKQGDFDIVQAKQDLVKKATLLKKLTGASGDEQEINHLLTRMVSAGASKDVIAENMQEYGVYLLDLPESKTTISPFAVGTTDMQMTNPIIMFDSNSSQWIITGGGYWKNDNWQQHMPTVWCQGPITVGQTCSVGGEQAFGVGFTNVSGSYTGVALNSVYAFMSDGDGNEISTTVRSDGNGALGFGFRLQDSLRIKVARPINSTVTYIGKHFAGLARYNAKFSAYDGNATSYFTHTYDNSVISNVTFGVGSQMSGVSVQTSVQTKSFPAFSGDTLF
ncbi:hypothetical protein [Paenibacillus sp. NPDC058174]|uniref:hypothetical protein n=1 Tax=Paenibacillus sp. NPDC058174 TaxID=3346366 RepID=UPI0036DC8F1F